MDIVLSAAVLLLSGILANAQLLIRPEDSEAVVGQTVQINCGTADKYSVHWEHVPIGSSRSKDVYVSRTIVTPYHIRYKIGGDSANGEYNLIISNVQLDDSGKYACTDRAGHGDKKEAELIVLASVPECRSNINPDGMIGDNDCGIEPEDIEFKCSLKYSGNLYPVLEWKNTEGRSITPKTITIDRAPGQVTSTAIIRPNNEINGHSITCQTTLSKVTWTSETLKVLYVLNTSSASRIIEPSHETCSANSSQQCTYKWTEMDPKGTNVKTFTGSSIYIDHPGRFSCEADCLLRGQQCTVQAKLVEFISTDCLKNIIKQENSVFICLSVVKWLATLAVFFAISTFFGWTATVFFWRNRSLRGLRYGLKTITLDDNMLVLGMTILHEKLYVILLGQDRVLVYQLMRSQDSYQYHVFPEDMSEPREIAACSITNRLYISFALIGGKMSVFTMETNGVFTKWLEGITDAKFTISVSSEGDVLLPQYPNKILIYASNRTQLKTVTLSADVLDIQHAIQLLPSGNFVVCHGEINDVRHEVLMVSRDGKTVINRYGGERGHDKNQLNRPTYAATYSTYVERERIFVADKGNNRVIVFDKTLKFLHDITSPEILEPNRLCCFQGGKLRLVVGQHGEIHIFSRQSLYGIVKKWIRWYFPRKKPSRQSDETGKTKAASQRLLIEPKA